MIEIDITSQQGFEYIQYIFNKMSLTMVSSDNNSIYKPTDFKKCIN